MLTCSYLCYVTGHSLEQVKNQRGQLEEMQETVLEILFNLNINQKVMQSGSLAVLTCVQKLVLNVKELWDFCIWFQLDCVRTSREHQSVSALPHLKLVLKIWLKIQLHEYEIFLQSGMSCNLKISHFLVLVVKNTNSRLWTEQLLLCTFTAGYGQDSAYGQQSYSQSGKG